MIPAASVFFFAAAMSAAILSAFVMVIAHGVRIIL